MRTVFLCELMEQQEIQAHVQQAHKLCSTTIYFKTTPRLQRSITASINASASAPQAPTIAPQPDAGPGLDCGLWAGSVGPTDTRVLDIVRLLVRKGVPVWASEKVPSPPLQFDAHSHAHHICSKYAYSTYPASLRLHHPLIASRSSCLTKRRGDRGEVD